MPNNKVMYTSPTGTMYEMAPTGNVRLCQPQYDLYHDWQYNGTYGGNRMRYSDKEEEVAGGWNMTAVYWSRQWRWIPDSAMLQVPLEPKNSTRSARYWLADQLAKEGFTGPLKAGEVICLRTLLEKLGKGDHVRRSYIYLKTKKKRSGRWNNGQEYDSWSLRYCYVFKSPIPGLDMPSFIKLARLYKGDAGMRKGILELIKRPVAELKEELETFGTLDVLAGMKAA